MADMDLLQQENKKLKRENNDLLNQLKDLIRRLKDIKNSVAEKQNIWHKKNEGKEYGAKANFCKQQILLAEIVKKCRMCQIDGRAAKKTLIANQERILDFWMKHYLPKNFIDLMLSSMNLVISYSDIGLHTKANSMAESMAKSIRLDVAIIGKYMADKTASDLDALIEAHKVAVDAIATMTAAIANKEAEKQMFEDEIANALAVSDEAAAVAKTGADADAQLEVFR